MPDRPQTRLARALARHPALVLFTLATAACAPLLAHGVPWGHDLRPHLLWSDQFQRQLAGGELYPRWLLGLGKGFGAPVFFFYPPLTYYLTSALAPILFDPSWLPWRLAIVGWLAVYASGWTLHLWLRRHIGSAAALFGAALYMLVPYHLLADLYLRIALPEVVGFVWPPLLLWAVDEGDAAPRRALVSGALAWGLLLLTHAPTALTAAPLPLAWAALRATRTRSLRPPGLALAQLALGAGLAGVYLATALTQGPYRNEAVLFNGFSHYSRWFVTLHPPSRFVGLVFANGALLAASCAAASALAALTRARAPAPRGAAWLVQACAAGAAAYFFLMLRASNLVWEHLPLLQHIQYVWRLNSELALLASGCLGALGAHLAAAFPARRRALGTAGAGVLVVLLATQLAAATHAAEIFDPHYKTLTSRRVHRLIAKGYLPPEYWVPRERDPAALFAGAERTAFLRGSGEARVEEWRPRHLVLDVVAQGPARLAVRQQFYPGWEAHLDGHPDPIPVDLLRREYGVLAVDLPAGAHRLVLTLGPTPHERLGWVVSGISVVLLAALAAAWRPGA